MCDKNIEAREIKHRYKNIDREWCFLTRTIDSQYIGMKDKNGVEIYENDIVRFDDPMESYSSCKDYLVAWDNNICGFALKNLDSSDLYLEDCFEYAPFSAGEDCFEVIGNKFDNSDKNKRE